MKKINLKGINKETVIGIVIQIVVVVNAVLQMFGYKTLPISDNTIDGIISTVFLIVVTGYNTYKNRNVTKASQIGQSITDMIKNGELLAEDVETVVKDIKNTYKK